MKRSTIMSGLIPLILGAIILQEGSNDSRMLQQEYLSKQAVISEKEIRESREFARDNYPSRFNTMAGLSAIALGSYVLGRKEEKKED